ncbi:glycosyltransferase family 39 protein [Actinoplanes sp. DH11]|uniref:glycosyltransferase family 39 protein n=1 Tax=Actinoplanes sp. DH11 TaxID=2857011 RepID=UPI001E471526|nr:glycosyltransferase family 39 protein [Actinoplanes sp. DH11]
MEAETVVIEREAEKVAPEPERRRPRRLPVALGLILVLAAAVRLFRFPGTPVGLSQDEVSAGYETMSLLAAGTDRWGNRWPVYFSAFGSGQNVLLSYLNMPFLAILGPSPLGLRLLPALLGVLSVYAAYALTTRLAGRRAGLFAALLLAILPWHVMMSRWSLESNMLPPVMLLAVWWLVAAYQSPRRWLLPLSLAPLALVFYAYAAATPVVIVFVVAVLAREWRTLRARPVAGAAAVGVFGLVALPYGLFVLANQVLGSVPGWMSWLPFGIQLLPGNRIDEINAESMAGDNFLFTLHGFDDSRPWNVMDPYLPLGLIVVPLAAAGLVFALRGRFSYLIAFWLFATLPMFFLFPLNVNRINVIFLPLVILAALGLDGIVRSMSDARAGTGVVAALLTVGLVYNGAFVLDYFERIDRLIRLDFSSGVDGALAFAATRAAPGMPIYVTDQVPLNYLYVLFHREVDPREFRANAEYGIDDSRYFVRNYRSYYFHPDDPALAAAPVYVALFRTDEPSRCAGGGRPGFLTTVDAIRVVRCARPG